jgi:hypothetical protein
VCVQGVCVCRVRVQGFACTRVCEYRVCAQDVCTYAQPIHMHGMHTNATYALTYTWTCCTWVCTRHVRICSATREWAYLEERVLELRSANVLEVRRRED